MKILGQRGPGLDRRTKGKVADDIIIERMHRIDGQTFAIEVRQDLLSEVENVVGWSIVGMKNGHSPQLY